MKKRLNKKSKNFSLSKALKKFNQKIPDSLSLEKKQELLMISFGEINSIKSKKWVKEIARDFMVPRNLMFFILGLTLIYLRIEKIRFLRKFYLRGLSLTEKILHKF